MARNRRLLVAGIAVVAIAAVTAGWYFFLRGDAPAQVSLGGAVASLSATPAPAPAATGTVTGGDVTAATLVGAWQVVPANSFVGYRVQEQLASIGANTAVGRTSSVTGSLQFDGTAITTVHVEADLTSLKSDDSRRDGTLRRQSLQTAQFPSAGFELTQPIVLDHPPAEGETITATAVGRLTLHGVTRDVAIPIQGQLAGGRVVAVGSLEIQFGDYGIAPPTALSVLSVDDHAVIELQLVFARSGS